MFVNVQYVFFTVSALAIASIKSFWSGSSPRHVTHRKQGYLR